MAASKITEQEFLEHFAQELHYITEKLDPTDSSWKELSNSDRDFYVSCVDYLFNRTELSAWLARRPTIT